MGLIATLRNTFTRLGYDLGRPDGATAQAVVLVNPASGEAYSPLSPIVVELLGTPAVARSVAATAASANTALTATCRRISIKAMTSNARYVVGAGVQVADASASHFIEVGERLDMAVPAGANIAVIRDVWSVSDGVLHITELS